MGLTKDGKVGGDDGTAVIAYLGDGAMSEGDSNEALVWSTVFTAPVVFFCQNNQYAISASSARQSRIPLYRRADGFGLPGVQVDGNDVLASYAVTRAALSRARHGEGPTFIEAVTYRMAAHTTSDDATRYRSADEVEHWRQRDPIARYRAFLQQEGLGSNEFFADVDAEADDRAADLRALTLALPDPQVDVIFDNVYADRSPELDRQQREYTEYLNSFDDTTHAATGSTS
jgi:pyruvate dehydrogenase E1 component alpha subunit